MNPDAIESLVRDVLEKMNGATSQPAAPASHAATPNSSITANDYPIAEKHPEWVKTLTNKTLSDITLENVMNGTVTEQDIRVTPEVLRIQAQVARASGREKLANNFERAAELTVVPDDRVLEIYNALRPYRSTKEELIAIATELESKYQAVICAAYVREAAELYQQRRKLKGDD
ncbi:MAG: diol dehydratase small subunit [Vibrio sp.]